MIVRGAPTEARRIVETAKRCDCPVCLGLDAMFPDGGYQLALFPYVGEPGSTPRLYLHFVRRK